VAARLRFSRALRSLGGGNAETALANANAALMRLIW
jgi:hypothetical protein